MKRFLITLALAVMILVAPVTRAEAATAKKPVVSSVVKKPKKTTIKFKKYSKNTIYYTTNGKTPKKGSSYTKKYSSKITITSTKTVKAVSYVGKKKSKIFSKKYTVYPKPTISTSSVTLTVGKTKKLTIKNAKTTIKWSSSKKSVATVSGKGKVTAKKAGTATITAKVNGGKVTCSVTVKKKSATSKIDYGDDDDVKDTVTTSHVPTLHVGEKSISLGDSSNSLVKTLGNPDRIDKTQEVCYSRNAKITRYVYNSDYSKIMFFDVCQGDIVSIYSSSPYITLDGIIPGTTQKDNIESTLVQVHGKDISISSWAAGTVTYSNDVNNCYINCDYDNYSGSTLYGKVVSVWATEEESSEFSIPEGITTDENSSYERTMVLESLDLTNAYRYLFDREALIYDTRGYAEKEAIAHTHDMIDNNFFSHESTRFKSLGHRITAAYCTVHDSHPYDITGYGCSVISENDGENCSYAIYGGTVITLMQSLFHSTGHRYTFLNSSYKEYGAAFISNDKGTRRYLTQEFVTYVE